MKKEKQVSICRAALKLQSLQRLCRMDIVFVQHITMVLGPVGGAELQQDVMMTREEVTCCLNRMFQKVWQEVPGHVTAEAAKQTCELVFRMFESSHGGCVSARSLGTILIALSADNVLLKFRGLVKLSENASGHVSRSGLRALLQDLSQVPAAVQEGEVFGSVEAGVRSCFNGVLTQTVSEEHVMSWLQTDPHLLLWLPVLHRLLVSQKVNHGVRCHTCKTSPITGLRFRCAKCVNVHLCQSCFLTNQQSRKHKTHHQVLEFWVQPTWRESLTSLVHNACHNLLPRQRTQRDADRRTLMWAEHGETQISAPPPSDASTPLAVSAPGPSSHGNSSHDALVHLPPPLSTSKALQTDENLPDKQTLALLTEVRNLQRDKWLLEQQLHAWRHTVQSEHGLLDDRCSHVEVTIETLRRDNIRLQDMLTQDELKSRIARGAKDFLTLSIEDTSDRSLPLNRLLCLVNVALKNMEAPQHVTHTPQKVHEETTDSDQDTEEEDEEEETSTILQDSCLSHDAYCEEEEEEPLDDKTYYCPTGERNGPEEEEPVDDKSYYCPTGEQNGHEEEGLHEDNVCQSEEENDCGGCSQEEILKKTVDRLKMVLETDRCMDRRTGERQRVELLEAAGQVRHRQGKHR
ncbi:dystrotelin [Xenentodon cancila]